MCGFVSLISPEINERLLKGLRDTLIHRGPDGEGLWIGEASKEYKVGLAHRRLKILDLSERGAQPMWTHDAQQGIIFNGEIYNFKDLRAELKSKGIVFKSETDTEVLLNCYKVYGLDFVKKLNGMFAFTIWDRTTNQLIAVRDRFGEKPLYYSYLPKGGVILASEIKAILAHPNVEIEHDQEMLDNFSIGQINYTTNRTYFKGIYKVRPSHIMIFDEKGQLEAETRYWKPSITPEDRKFTNGDIQRFRDLLEKSVKGRFQADVDVGICLSGGLDSSLITGIASRIAKPKLALSARFPSDPTIDEGVYMDSVLNYTNVDGLAVYPTPKGLMEENEKLHYYQEEPFLSASMYLEWCVQKAAKASGITVMLDGQGADEVLGGYQYYFQHFQFDLVKRLKWLSFFKETYLFSNRLHREAEKYEESERRFRKEICYSSSSFLSLLRTSYNNISNDIVSEKNVGRFRYQQLHGLMYDMLPSQLHSADRNGMAHSIESRFPFLDYEFVDWCLSLPASFLVHNGWQKYILRRSAENIIPSNVQWRVDKVGFAAPLDKWMRHDMKDWCQDRLGASCLKTFKNYASDQIAIKWQEHLNGVDNSWNLWRWISLAEWLAIKWNKVK